MAARRRVAVARLLWIVVPAAAAVLGYRHRVALGHALVLVRTARPAWLAAAVGAIAGVYLARAGAYGVPLRVLGYTVRLRFLWSTAVAATSLHQLLPLGGATGYAFLTYALQQRGVAAGQASLIALIDTLSYAAAMATLVLATLAYLLVSGAVGAAGVGAAAGPGVLLLGLAGLMYVAQRDHGRLERLALGAKDRLARTLGRQWSDRPVRRFVDEYFAGKTVITRHRHAYLRMVGFQYLAVGCDAGALYLAFFALGLGPHPWTVLMALVVAMTGGAVLAAPAGGGGFEVIMSAFLTVHGVPEDRAIAVTLLYRLVALWLPVATTLAVLARLRRRRRGDILRRRRAAR